MDVRLHFDVSRERKISRTEFGLVCRKLGWGDAEQGVWFIGIEEATPWSDVNEIRSKCDGASYFEKIAQGSPPDLERAGASIRVITSKVIATLRGNFDFWEDQRARLWQPGSHVAQANLFPLGRPNNRIWTSRYAELFGYAANDYKRYAQDVRDVRYSVFQEARRELAPQAIVCFGKTYWREFADALDVSCGTRSCVNGKGLANDIEKVMFVPFFAYGHVTDADAREIARELRKWNVTISGTT